jgi:hypothetical protein
MVVLLAFLLAAFALAMGQGTTGGTQDQKKAESCCAEGAKCCAEGSCKHEANAESCCKDGAECCKDGAECCKKHADKDHADCCGESCELGGKHDAKAKHDSKKAGECCNVKNKAGKTKTKAD